MSILRTKPALFLLAAAVLASLPGSARAAAIEEITSANAEGHTVFLVLTDAAARNLEQARKVAKAAQQRTPKSVVVELNRSDPAQKEAVARYRVAAAPVPIVMVIASNGVAVGASRVAKGAVERLVGLVPTPGKAEYLRTLQERRTALVVFYKPDMKEQSAIFESVSKAVTQLKGKAGTVLVNIDDPAEKRFCEEWGIPEKSLRPTVVVMNAKGQPLGRLVGAQPADKIIATANEEGRLLRRPELQGLQVGRAAHAREIYK